MFNMWLHYDYSRLSEQSPTFFNRFKMKTKQKGKNEFIFDKKQIIILFFLRWKAVFWAEVILIAVNTVARPEHVKTNFSNMEFSVINHSFIISINLFAIIAYHYYNFQGIKNENLPNIFFDQLASKPCLTTISLYPANPVFVIHLSSNSTSKTDICCINVG